MSRFGAPVFSAFSDR